MYPNSFYTVTGLLMKRTAVTRRAHYPVTFGTGPKFTLHVHHVGFNKAQKILVLFYSNPPGGWAGIFPLDLRSSSE